MGVSTKKSPFEKIYVRTIRDLCSGDRRKNGKNYRLRYRVILNETGDKCKVSAMENLLEREA
jgi:hypothetical protein